MAVKAQIIVECIGEIRRKKIELVCLILPLEWWHNWKALPPRNSIIIPEDYQHNIFIGGFHKSKWKGIDAMVVWKEQEIVWEVLGDNVLLRCPNGWAPINRRDREHMEHNSIWGEAERWSKLLVWNSVVDIERPLLAVN